MLIAVRSQISDSIQNIINRLGYGYRACSSGQAVGQLPSSRYIPRRALMYVPGSDERKLSKIPSMDADCIVMDCEDGVAITRKEEARQGVAQFLNAGIRPRRGELGVRINSVFSGLLRDDLGSLASSCDGNALPDALMLPKVDFVDDLHTFSTYFGQTLKPLLVKANRRMKLVIWIESAVGLMNMRDILRAATTGLREHLPLDTDAVVFGSDDFCADIGATRSIQASELLYARQKFVTVCKAFHLQAIDIVYIDFKDLDGLRAQSDEGRCFGFTGKQVIHPSQVPVVQEAFLPPPEKVEWAKELLAQYEVHVQSGTGAFTFRGQMIDMPLVLQAKNVVQLMDSIREP